MDQTLVAETRTLQGLELLVWEGGFHLHLPLIWWWQPQGVRVEEEICASLWFRGSSTCCWCLGLAGWVGIPSWWLSFNWKSAASGTLNSPFSSIQMCIFMMNKGFGWCDSYSKWGCWRWCSLCSGFDLWSQTQSTAVWRMLHCHAALKSAGEEQLPLTSQWKPLYNDCARTKEQVFLPGMHRNYDSLLSSCLICIQQQNSLVPCSRECQGGQSAKTFDYRWWMLICKQEERQTPPVPQSDLPEGWTHLSGDRLTLKQGAVQNICLPTWRHYCTWVRCAWQVGHYPDSLLFWKVWWMFLFLGN